MPLYGLTSRKNLAPAVKQELVDLFTTAHCSIMVAQSNLFMLFFLRNSPLKKQISHVHANVLIGRTKEQIDKAKASLQDVLKYSKVNKDKIHINMMKSTVSGLWKVGL